VAVTISREPEVGRQHASEMSPAVIGAETGLRDVMRQVEQVARTSAPVLIFGETGSGKEVVARAIHERSTRANGPVLRVNCGAIPPELIDSELFGHERGSFTGAVAQRSGWFERADGGTLFLDEIAELSLAAQVRLLRVVQDGSFERVGGGRPMNVDVRVVAATHRDLAAMAEQGTFRADLWYRLAVFTIRLPALRERQADIGALAAHFAELAARRLGATSLRLDETDGALLRAYDWPGNVRELAAVIERAVVLGDGRRLEIARALGGAVTPAAVFPTLDDAIRTHIERALERCRGRIDGPRGAAHLLAIHANTLRSKMQKLGISPRTYRPED
jgi:DNA-binding NtrC family response regulator